MADIKHLRLLRKGQRAWNSWRQKNPEIPPDLSETTVKSWIDSYYQCDLGIGLAKKRLNLSGVDFKRTRFDGCNMQGSDFTKSNLTGAVFEDCDLSECKFDASIWSKTILINCNLKNVAGLENVNHHSSSVLDHMTLTMNPRMNVRFLRGVGLSDSMIDYLPSLTAQPIDFYTCFISYSSKDEEFVRRLHADLQDNGVRCWYAPEDMKIGDKIRDSIDQAIRVREKLLLVLSQDSINSSWVENEVETALEEEGRVKRSILFPIMIDNCLFDTEKAWASSIRRTRHIGGFSEWRNLDSYAVSFARLLRDLKQSAASECR